MFNGQCFPRYRYKTKQSVSPALEHQNPIQPLLPTECQTSISSNLDNVSQDGDSVGVGGVFDETATHKVKGLPLEDHPENDLEPIDNITDSALDMFQKQYRDSRISKDDIFDYVYGVLHAPDFRNSYPVALSRQLPRIPLAEDFWSFATAGQKLSDLHLGYETCPEYDLQLEYNGERELQSHHFRLGTKPMKYAGKKGDPDTSVVIINPHLKLTGIPDAAHDYVVNGRTPLEWYMDRYKVSTNKKSGIVNDPNKWFDKPEDLVTAIRRIVYVSVETTRIVNAFPSSIKG